MIRYALACADCDHGFEAWFSSSAAYDMQAAGNLIECPHCHGNQIGKAIMSPAVTGTRKQSGPDPQKVFGKLAAAARQHVAENFAYVGDGFATEATAMHYGETEHRPIWGETTGDERSQLKAQGIPAEPLHPAFVPPKPVEPEKLN